MARDDGDTAFSMKRGNGFAHKRDGLCRRQVLATYTHLHALGAPSWAPAVVNQARLYRNRTKKGQRFPTAGKRRLH